MLPEGARRAPNEGLEASGAPLGTMWAQSGRQERVKSHFKAKVEAMLGVQKLFKIHQEPQTSFQTRFSVAKRRKMMNWDLGQERAGKKASKSHTPTEIPGFPARPGA